VRTIRPTALHLNRYIMYDIYQLYSNFFVRVPPDVTSLQLCTPKAVGV
jgi:hypothetical protein